MLSGSRVGRGARRDRWREAMASDEGVYVGTSRIGEIRNRTRKWE